MRSLSPYLGDMPGYSVRQGTARVDVSPRLGRPSGPASLAYHRRRLAYHARTMTVTAATSHPRRKV